MKKESTYAMFVQLKGSDGKNHFHKVMEGLSLDEASEAFDSMPKTPEETGRFFSKEPIQ